ncbi:aryl-alcohol dehydrogenase Aad14 [Penicillium daleae]|uniref:Aryl-alcohol dehydrogenase Aad14 n=1 Tax=Penicillium daleae TaxID=63821 RepID=A0AAD6CGX4_9EURO|nr:aryl-alcohol dehydrogenase Aad14 [Penicillium daleae]KAJ5464805.1 aryl-alcohol dehydrogenase Aad14 [Penicillium daleae]
MSRHFGIALTPWDVLWSTKFQYKKYIIFVTAIAITYVVSMVPNVFALEQIQYLERVNPLNVGFPYNFIGPDTRETGDATGLLAANTKLAFLPALKAISPS